MAVRTWSGGERGGTEGSDGGGDGADGGRERRREDEAGTFGHGGGQDETCAMRRRRRGAAGGAFWTRSIGTRGESSAGMRVFSFVENVISMLTISCLAIPYCLRGKEKRQKYKTKSVDRARWWRG